MPGPVRRSTASMCLKENTKPYPHKRDTKKPKKKLSSAYFGKAATNLLAYGRTHLKRVSTTKYQAPLPSPNLLEVTPSGDDYVHLSLDESPIVASSSFTPSSPVILVNRDTPAPSTLPLQLNVNITNIPAANGTLNEETVTEFCEEALCEELVGIEEKENFMDSEPMRKTPSISRKPPALFFSDELKQRVTEREARRIDRQKEKFKLLKARLAEWKQMEA